MAKRTPARAQRKPRRTPPLSKASTGIHGLDELTGGGLPRGRPTLLCGSAGCGKTLMAMEFLVRGALDSGEPGVFMAFEESDEELTTNFASLGHDLSALVANKKLSIDFVRVERSEMAQTGECDLEGLFIRLGHAIDSIGAKRVVLDTIEVLFSGLPDAALLRSELQRLFRWLKARGITAIITAERGETALTRHGLEEYVADCVILLDHRVEGQMATRRLRIVKYRGSTHSANEYPFLIDEGGISILPLTSARLEQKAGVARVSSGVPRLDAMMGGKGYYRGSTVLVSGTAGSGKTSLAAHFAAGAAERGERCLWFSFYESSSQIIRNMRSIGINLAPAVRRGTLRIEAERSTIWGLEMQLVTIHKLVNEFKPSIVIIDPASAFATLGSEADVKAMMTRLIDFFKVQGVTALITSLTGGDATLESTEVAISALMDTWLLLRDVHNGAERNRVLHLVKSRGMKHSNQVREFLLTDHGVELRDVYAGPSGVLLTGSARGALEAQEKAQTLLHGQETQSKRHNLERKRQAMEAQIAVLRAKYEVEEAEAARTIGQDQTRAGVLAGDRVRMARERQSDKRAAPERPAKRRGDQHEAQVDKPARPRQRGTKPAKGPEYILRLYVAGMTPRSTRAIANIKEICEGRLKGRYDLQVIDLYQHPELAAEEQIVALPTLIRKLPQPLRRMVGDLSDLEKVLIGLELRAGLDGSRGLMKKRRSGAALDTEMDVLRTRLATAEEDLRAIRSGDVDAVLVTGERGDQVFTLTGADRAYRQLVETMGEGAATLSADGVILYCNDCLAMMLGRPLDQVIGSALRRWLPPADHQALAELLLRARTETARTEIALVTAGGTAMPVYLSASHLSPDGAETVTCLVLTDLTAQRHLEKVAAAEQLARSILEQAAEAIVVCDIEGRVTRASLVAEQLCDGGLLRRPFAEAFPLQTPDAQAFNLISVLKGETLRDVDVALRQQGRELALMVSARPLVRDQEIFGCVITWTDITARKRVEDDLRKKDFLLSEAQRLGSVGSWYWDLVGPMTWSDETYRVYGVESDTFEPTVENLVGLIHPEDRPTMQAWIGASIGGEQPSELAFRINPPDGTTRHVLGRGEVALDAAGQPAYMAGTVQDITERMQAEQTLRLQGRRAECRRQRHGHHRPQRCRRVEQHGVLQAERLQRRGEPGDAPLGRGTDGCRCRDGRVGRGDVGGHPRRKRLARRGDESAQRRQSVPPGTDRHTRERRARSDRALHRDQGGPDGSPLPGEPTPAIPEDGDGGAARRRGRPRLQQPPHGHQRDRRPRGRGSAGGRSPT